MVSTTVDSRRTIEALRSGVPSDAAVQSLGTTQATIERRFLSDLDLIGEGVGARPLVITANFGDGKSHLLHFLRIKAEEQGFVTSSVVVSPEVPIGNAHVALKAIAEEARAPGRTGKAMIELASAAGRTPAADLRLWAREAPIHDRFRALLRIYEATADDELRVLILNDIEGHPLAKSRIVQELRALGELSQFDLKSPRNPLLAHDRIQLLAQFSKSHGAKGIVVLFDEVERILNFSFAARLAVYQEIGWWRSICETGSTPLYAVFAQTAGSIEQCLVDKGDEARIRASGSHDERDEWAKKGIELLRKPLRPERSESAALIELQHGVRELYALAYDCVPAPLDARPAWTTVRSEIRRWITHWDLARHYPTYRAVVESDAVHLDLNEFPDDLLETGADSEP